MEQEKSFPQWVQNAIGSVLVTSVVVLAGAVWTDRVDIARVDERLKQGAERIEQLEISLREFRKPGGRYTAKDGDRDRAVVSELKKEFREFTVRGSRALPTLIRLEKRLEECIELAKSNRDHWYACKSVHDKLESELYFWRKTRGYDDQTN